MADVEKVADRYRFEITVEGEPAGFLEFRNGPGVRALTHTKVEESHRGTGVAEMLVTRALEETRDEGLQVEPYCPYVQKFIAKHREWLDLVPGDRREVFKLPA